MAEVRHPIRGVPGVEEHVALLRADVLHSLPVPWPRSQDLAKDTFTSPCKEDLVLAVSHAWQYQAHPDPVGGTHGLIDGLLHDALAAHRPQGRAVLFYDFMSASQRPFARGQANRTPQEQKSFGEALKAFPYIYLMADATLHLEVMCDAVPGDEEVYTVNATELDGLDIIQLGDTVRVASWPPETSTSSVAPCDAVLAVEGKPVTSKADLQPDPGGLGWQWERCGCGGRQMGSVTMQRAPFGARNRLPASLKGWVYLERFVSMVKVAMVPESQALSVAFSNKPKILEQIFTGGRRLREAAAAGQQALQGVLEELARELDTKRFAATSVDKATNTGGVGGLTGATKAPPSDRDVVFGMMQELVQHLVRHWETELRSQQQRQLLLAVSRGDAPATTDLLAAGAAVNHPDPLGVTSLHVAAKFRNLQVAQVLLAGGAALGAEDVLGNTPAHMVTLLSDDRTVPIFRLLAPTERELTAKNKAGVTPLLRFQMWATVELSGKPFEPATACLEELRRDFPGAFLAKQRSMAEPGDNPEEVDHGHPLPAIRESEATCQVDGRAVKAIVFEPPSGEHSVDVVCLSLSFFVPPVLAEAALRTMAQRVCNRAPARIFCLGVSALSPASLSADSFSATHEDLLRVMDALPLRKPFVLLDSGLGEATPLIWRLKDSLKAAVVVNLRGFHSDVFPGSDMCTKVVSRFEKISGMFAERRLDDLVGMLGDYAFAPGVQELDSLACAYKVALGGASPAFFDHSAFHCRLVARNIMERTNQYKSLGPLGGPRVAIACGQFSPGMWTLEAAPRLNALVPNSFIEHIPNDKSCWELEGVHQAFAIADILEGLILSDAFESPLAPQPTKKDEWV